VQYHCYTSRTETGEADAVQAEQAIFRKGCASGSVAESDVDRVMDEVTGIDGMEAALNSFALIGNSLQADTQPSLTEQSEPQPSLTEAQAVLRVHFEEWHERAQLHFSFLRNAGEAIKQARPLGAYGHLDRKMTGLSMIARLA